MFRTAEKAVILFCYFGGMENTEIVNSRSIHVTSLVIFVFWLVRDESSSSHQSAAFVRSFVPVHGRIHLSRRHEEIDLNNFRVAYSRR
jgi:hypothetical protein